MSKKFLLLLLLIIIIICGVCMCVRTRICVCGRDEGHTPCLVYESQRTIVQSGFSPSALVWVAGTELWCLPCMARVFIHWAILLAAGPRNLILNLKLLVEHNIRSDTCSSGGLRACWQLRLLWDMTLPLSSLTAPLLSCFHYYWLVSSHEWSKCYLSNQCIPGPAKGYESKA